MNWLEDMCNVFENPKFPQIIGRMSKSEEGEIVGKCALGELRCNKNVNTSPEDDTDMYGNIMKSFNIPFDIINGLPRLSAHYGEHGWYDPVFNFEREDEHIQTYIWKLNDCGFTYTQLVEFLKETFGDTV